jgi:hypothetical protein
LCRSPTWTCLGLNLGLSMEWPLKMLTARVRDCVTLHVLHA